jgi:PAS domain S-box-containing protein
MPDLSPNVLNDCALAFDLDDQKFLFVDPNISGILGYNATDFYQNVNLLSELVDPLQRLEVAEKINKISEGQSVNLLYKAVTATGELKWVCDKKRLFTDEQSGHKIMLSIIKKHVPEKNGHNEEARLREKFLNSLIDSQTNFLIRFDTNGIFTFANKQFLKTLGYKKSEIIGKNFSTITVVDELEMCRKAFVTCIKHPGKVINHTHKKITKAGNILDTGWEFISVTNDDGEVIAIQGVGQDITQKLIIEKEIKEATEKLDTFIESITDSFFILDNDWKFVRVNSAFEKVCNTPRTEMLGNVIWELFPGIVDTAFEDAYRKAAAEQAKAQFTEYFGLLNMWFNVTVYPSDKGLTVFVKDISEEKRAQEELIWTKNSLEGLINNTEDQIWSVDKETRYVCMNKAYTTQIFNLTGYEPQEGGYSYLHVGYSEEVIEIWNEYYNRALNGEIFTIINESTDPFTQQVLSFEVRFNPIFKTKGEITGVGCFARNITERLKSEKSIIDQNERLRHIASLTSHELRRPVASMLGLINIMDRVNFYNPDNKEVIEHLLTVGIEIDEVIRLIVDKAFAGSPPNKSRTQ